MTREEKSHVIEDLTEKFKEKPYFYVTDASGLTVSQINNFRRICFERNMEYKVAKNTLIKVALDNIDGDYSEFDHTVLKGFSGILFSDESGSAPAKLLKEYYKKGNKKPTLKGASVDSSLFIGEDQLDALSKVKSKADVIAELIGLLQSPGINLARTLKSPSEKLVLALKDSSNKLVGVLKAIEEKSKD